MSIPTAGRRRAATIRYTWEPPRGTSVSPAPCVSTVLKDTIQTSSQEASGKCQITKCLRLPLDKTLFSSYTYVSKYSHASKGKNMAGETRDENLDAAEKLILLRGLALGTRTQRPRERGLAEPPPHRPLC